MEDIGPCFELSVTSPPGFYRQGRSVPECNGFIRFASGATPTDLLTASIAAEPFFTN